MSIEDRRQQLQTAVEQHLGPFLEQGALDDLVITVVPREEGQREHMVQLSGIPDLPEGPLRLSQAKERIIAWARTRQAAVPQGEAPAAHMVEDMLDQLRAMVAESILDPASRQLLTLIKAMIEALSPPGQQVPAELVSTIQLLQRVLTRVRYPGEGAVAAPFGPSKAGKSHLLSLMVGILVTHLTYELLPPQHTRFVMDRAGDAIIKSQYLRGVPQDILDQVAEERTVTIKLPAAYLQADPEEEGILSVTLERQRNMEILGEYQKTGQLGDAYQSWLASQTDMPTTQIPYSLSWGDTHQVVLAVATREDALVVLLEVQGLADTLLRQAAAGKNKARKKSAGSSSSRGTSSLLEDLKRDGLAALKQHLLAGNPSPEVKEGYLSALGRYADLCGPQLQWAEDNPQLDKQQLQMKPEVETFLTKFGGKLINCSSWPGAPGAADAGLDPWQLPRQALAQAADAFMCGVLRVVQGCASPAVRQLCLPALLEAGIPEGLLEFERGKAPPLCALLKSAHRLCPSEELAGGLTFLELPGTGVNNAQHKAHAREALRRITHPVCMFYVEADEGMLDDIQRNYLTQALVDLLKGGATGSRQAQELEGGEEGAQAGQLHLAQQLATQRREPLLVSCLEAKKISLGEGSGATALSLDTVAHHLTALASKEAGNQQQALRVYQEEYLEVLLSNVDRLLTEGAGIEGCVKWLQGFARRAPAAAQQEEEESSEEGSEEEGGGAEGEEDAGAAPGDDGHSDDDDDDVGDGNINPRMRAIIRRMARATVQGAGLPPAVAKLRRRNAKAQLRRLLSPPTMTVYPSLLFSYAVNPSHAATLAAEGVNVDAAVNHITSGMAQLMGHLTSATPQHLQEVVEALLTGLDQHLAALGSVVQGLQRWKMPRPYVNRKVKQAGGSKMPGRNPGDVGGGVWRDVAVAIDAFCSSTATAVPSAGQRLTNVVLRQRLRKLVDEWAQRAQQRMVEGDVAAAVRSMGQALQQEFPDARQRLHHLNRAIGLQRSTVGRDPRFDVMSLIRDEVFHSQQEGAQLLGELLHEVEHFALDTLANELVNQLLLDFQNQQSPASFLTPEVREALSSQLLEAARAQLQDAVDKFNVVGNNRKVLSAQEVDRHVTQVLEDALLALFSEAREAAMEAAGGSSSSRQPVPGASPADGKKRARGTTRNPGQQVDAMLLAVEEGLPEVVQQVAEELADSLWGTISRGVGAFGDALGWGASLRRKNTQRQMLLLTQHYNELLRKLRDITNGGARTKRGGMRASLATWRARFLAGWESAKLQEAVDSDLLSRLATSSASVSLPRAQGISDQQAQDLLQALGKAAAAAVQRAPLAASKHAAAAWKQRGTQPPAARRDEQELSDLDRARLSSILDQQGLQLTPTLGNGQCLANSLLTVLHGGSLPPVVLQHHATQVVRMALARLRELYRRSADWRQQIEVAVTAAGFSCFQDYVDQYMADPHTWGDHLLLQGMVEELGIAVMVYTSTATGVDAVPVWPTTVDDWTASHLSPYVIAYGEPAPGMGHYEAVLPKPAPQQQPEDEQLAQDQQPEEEEQEQEVLEEPMAVAPDQPAAMEVDAAAGAGTLAGEAAAAAAVPASTFRADTAAVAPSTGTAGSSQPTAVAVAVAGRQQVPSKGQRLQELCRTLMPVLSQVVTRSAAKQAAAAAADAHAADAGAAAAAAAAASPEPGAKPAGQQGPAEAAAAVGAGAGAAGHAAPFQAYSPTAAAAAAGGAAPWGRLNLQQREGAWTRSMVATGGYSRHPMAPECGLGVKVVLHDSILAGGAGLLQTLVRHLQARCQPGTFQVFLHRPLFNQLELVKGRGGAAAAPWEKELLPLLNRPHSRQSGASWDNQRQMTLGSSEERAASGPVLFAQEVLVGERAKGKDSVVLLVMGGPSAALLRTLGAPPNHRYVHLHPQQVPVNEVAVDVIDLQQALQVLDPQGRPDVAAAVRQAPGHTYRLLPRLANHMSLYVRKPRFS